MKINIIIKVINSSINLFVGFDKEHHIAKNRGFKFSIIPKYGLENFLKNIRKEDENIFYIDMDLLNIAGIHPIVQGDERDRQIYLASHLKCVYYSCFKLEYVKK